MPAITAKKSSRSRFKPRPARTGIVGNIVDGAAERIYFEHRLALGARQNAHAVIERAAHGARGGLCGLAHSCTPRLVRGGAKSPAETLRSAADNAEHRAAENTRHAEMHFFA